MSTIANKISIYRNTEELARKYLLEYLNHDGKYSPKTITKLICDSVGWPYLKVKTNVYGIIQSVGFGRTKEVNASDMDALTEIEDLTTFEIVVWYRYVVAGEQEKEYDLHNIEADNVQQAVDMAKALYPSHKRIPFGFYHNDIKYEPTKTDYATT